MVLNKENRKLHNRTQQVSCLVTIPLYVGVFVSALCIMCVRVRFYMYVCWTVSYDYVVSGKMRLKFCVKKIQRFQSVY